SPPPHPPMVGLSPSRAFSTPALPSSSARSSLSSWAARRTCMLMAALAWGVQHEYSACTVSTSTEPEAVRPAQAAEAGAAAEEPSQHALAQQSPPHSPTATVKLGFQGPQLSAAAP
ncbi:unnamed protein product, partial [Closterium sp. NIES-53]